MTQFKYNDYDEYLKIQKTKALKTMGTTKRHKECGDILHKLIKNYYKDIKGWRLLSLGARHETEVKQFIDLGYDAHGIDLYDRPPYITNCDMSKIYEHPELSKNKFDIFMSIHSLEHCIDMNGLVKSMQNHCRIFACFTPRVVIPNKWDCNSLKIMSDDTCVDKDFENTFDGFKVIWKDWGKLLGFILENKNWNNNEQNRHT